jgi:cysteine-rich repeat protein
MRPGVVVLWLWLAVTAMAVGPVLAEPIGVPAGTAACVGDCSGNRLVTVDEIVRAVDIALGEQPVSACPGITDGPVVTIDRLILAVDSLLSGCPLLPTVCGDHVVEAGEECDDGNSIGGDACAANCTLERRRTSVFSLSGSHLTVQTESVRLLLDGLTGAQTFTTGAPRDDMVVNGTTVTLPGEIPVVVKADDIKADPLAVNGTLCACLRGVATDAFGPGNAARGSIACGTRDVAPVSYRIAQDHDTNPGDAHNFGGLPDDPQCTAAAVLPDGALVRACREGVDPLCSDPAAHPHAGICNSPLHFVVSQDPAPPGSAIIYYHLALTLLADGGTCSTAGPGPGGECAFPDYGPDCLPCTDDDQAPTIDLELALTTGMAEGEVFDANLDSGATGRGAVIAADARCFGLPCETTAQGQPFDCDALTADPTGGVSGSALAGALPILDSRSIGDSVVTFTLATE